MMCGARAGAACIMARQASCGGKGVIKASAAAHVDDEAYESLHMNAAMLEVQNVVLTEHDGPPAHVGAVALPGIQGQSPRVGL